MPYDFRCATCNALLETEDRWVGREAVCPGCGARISVPRKSMVVQQTKPCPNCGSQMKQNDVICEDCSFNIMTGKVKKQPMGYKIYRRKKIKDVMKERTIINFPAVTLQIIFYSLLLFLPVGAFFYFIMPNSSFALYVALVLIWTGLSCNLLSFLMWLWAWYKSGLLWLLLCFFISPVILVYTLIHWERAKYPLGINIIAMIMLVSGVALAGPRLGGYLENEPRLLKPMVDYYIVERMKTRPVKFSEEEIVKLFKSSADLNKANEAGWMPLQRAVYLGDKDMVVKLLDKKIEVDGGIQKNLSPLMIAGMRGDKEIVELLLKAGANPMTKNHAGQSALMVTYNSDIKQMMMQTVNEAKEKEKVK